MFLSKSRRALAAIATSCVLLTPARATADAKQCVKQNNDGADLRDQHRMLAAREAYRACAAEPDCPAMVRSECDAALNDLRSAIPTLLVSVLDEGGHDLSGATLLVDGKAIALDGSALEVDPGAHDLTASSGTTTLRLRVLAVEKDLNRRLELVLKKAPPVTVAGNLTPPVWKPRRSRAPAYVLGGLAAAGAASFSYFALSGHSALADLKACRPYCDPDAVRRVRTKYTVADVSLGVSLAALAGAGFWLWSSLKEEPVVASGPLSVTLSAAPSAASLSVRWVE